jgi:hypothetical protein
MDLTIHRDLTCSVRRRKKRRERKKYPGGKERGREPMGKKEYIMILIYL